MEKYSGYLFIFYCLLIKFDVVYMCSTSRDCSDFQYCSSFGKICEPCSNICDKTNHNYDENRCEQDCKKYLQSLANEEIRTLRTLVSISLALNCVIIFFLILVAVYKYINWKTKGGISISWFRNKLKKKEKSKADCTSVSVTASSGKPDLRLDMPPIGIQTPSPNGNTPSTATTTLSRRPTEDNTLDYAYDNPAMTNSSSPKPHESSL